MLFGSLELSIIAEEVAVALLLLVVYVLSRVRRIKAGFMLSNTVFFVVAVFLMAIPIMQYAMERPYLSISIITSIVLAVMVFPLYGLLARYFGSADIDFDTPKRFIVRLLAACAAYVILYTITVQGIDFFFLGLVNPASVTLTPEFVSVGVPTFVFLMFLAYRLGRRFRSIPFNFLARVSEDLIWFSLAVFLLSLVATASGVQLAQGPASLNPNFEIALLAGIAGLMSEIVLVRIYTNLEKVKPGISLDLLIKEFAKPLTQTATKNQKTLDQFEVEKGAPEDRADDFFNRLDRKNTIRIGKRRLRPSLVITVVLLLGVAGLVYAYVTPVETNLLVQGVEIHSQIIQQPPPTGTSVITSEGTTDAVVGHVYAISIVKITAGNETFVAPLSNRYLILNSSGFRVQATGRYLDLSFGRAVINGSFRANLLERPSSNQTSNSAYSYFGIFGDAEICYALTSSGYSDIIVLSTTTATSTNIPATKAMFATSGNGTSVLIVFQSSGDIASLQTMTITTTDVHLFDMIQSLFQQAKMPIALSLVESSPSPGFSLARG